MAGIPWDAEEIRVLKEIILAGGTAKEASAIIGRALGGVEKKVNELRIRAVRKKNDIDMEAFKRFLKERGK